MGKLLDKENEQQVEKPQLTDEEKKVLDEARSIRWKARGNNGAKRDIHEECEVDIFKRGDTALDNNLVERMNRYFSMSRRSSLFFGSHKGAERAAVLYTLALSAKMNHLNFFDYLTDILDRTAQWQPNVPLENYRNLLPDRWQPSTKE